MNKEFFESQWAQIKNYIREKWSNLTDEDIRQINGRYDQLVSKLQQRYGYTREEAEAELRNWNYDRSKYGNERAYADTTTTRRVREDDNGSVLKWVLAAGIPLLLLLSWFAYDHSKYDTTRPVTQESIATETPEDRTINESFLRDFRNNDQLSPTAKSNVRITTSNGIVTVRGTVANEQERNIVLGIINRLSGVRQVNDQLQVR